MNAQNCSNFGGKKLHAFGEIQNSVDIAMLSLSTLAVLLNLSVIQCALGLFYRNFDTIHVYITSMTTADLLIVLCIMLESLDRLLFFLPHIPCSILHFIEWMSWTASGLSLVLLNSDKLLFFCFPLQYRIVKSVRRAVKLCLSLWLLSFCFVAYVWLSDVLRIGPSKYSPRCSANMNPHKLHIFTIYSLIGCVLPILSSLIVSCYLLKLMRMKRRSIKKTALRVTDSVSSELIDQEMALAPAFTRKLRSLAFIFITTLWTASSLLPYRVFVLVQYNLVPAMLADRCGWLAIWLSQLGWLLHYLLKLNPIVNPCITAIIYHPYRARLSSQFFNHFPSLSRNHSNRTVRASL